MSRPVSSSLPRRAVVIGAGLAGMLAAAALADVVDEVVVLERDELPQGPEHRRGVPQGRHAHLLMAGGMAAMEELVPGARLRKDLLAAGAHEIPLGRGMVALTPEGWLRRWRHTGPHMITCTRALLDWTVRQAVLDTARVRIRTARVEGLRGDADRVRGVRLSGPDGDDGELAADFVVDASGRGSRVLNWLELIGISDVPQRTVDAGLVNATRIYRTPAGAERFPLTMVQADPYAGRPGRSAMVLPIEGGRWMVSLAGTRGGEPPADPEGFLRYTLDLPDPIVGRLVSGAEPLTGIRIGHSTSNVRRHLEKTARWPEGFAVLGDAVATFNPAYGQGMSVAAFGARHLAEEVRRGGLAAPGLARRVQRAVAGAVDAAWLMAVSQDVWYLRADGGGPTLTDRLAARYTRRLTAAATGSYPAASALWAVTSMTAGPAALFRPSAVLAAALGSPLPALSGPPLTTQERTVLRDLDRTGATV
ncbi:FAD-dependent monooxygenase [Streptomyces sp. NPDC048290]|uniref:NAD(P)/FAD-dependent oxidoreductase n=1 Tax=Streptomyces sp. NPDC048290 TaxID=3155811 RepID=UPI003416EFDF